MNDRPSEPHLPRVPGTRCKLVGVEATHELRRLVLRGGDLNADVHFAEDATPGGFHVATFADGDLAVAVGSFSPQPVASRGDLDATWQVRGMAAQEPGSGHGSAVLTFGIDEVRGRDGRWLWANVRDTAQGFYAAHGFEVISDGFTTAATGLPHHRMLRRV